MKRPAAAALAIGLALTLQATPALADQNTDVVLVVDTSGSMSGPRIAKARPAVIEFVSKVPTTVKIGLVTFSSTAKTQSELTDDRTAIVRVMSKLKVSGDTALFDAIDRALGLLRDTSNRRIVVLSDGADNKSKLALKSLLENLRIARVPVDVIALKPNQRHLRTLQAIVSASGGRLLTANAIDDLLSAFQAAAQAFEPSASPPPVEDSEAILVEARTDIRWPVGLAIFSLVALLFLEGTTFGRVRRARSMHTMKRFVNQYSEVLQRRLRSKSRSELLEMLDEYLEGKFPKTTLGLDDANLNMPVSRWIFLDFVASFAVLLLAQLLIGALVFSLLLGALTFFLGPKAVLSYRISQLRREFADALPSTLSVSASSLRAGLTFAQALDTAIAEGQDEMARQMRRVLNEAQIGTPLETALMKTAERMQSEDLKWAVTALEIQREVGGSLAKILDTSAATIRNRMDLKREVRTLSAEGRLSGYVLAALPVFMFIYLAMTRREYVQVFWTEIIGFFMLTVIGISFTLGWIWVNKIVKIRV